MSYITGIPAAECVGRGTGVNDEQLERKKRLYSVSIGFYQPTIGANPDTPTILRCVGGFEIAMLTGAYLRAAENKMIILVDGFISTAALLLARLSNPFSHPRQLHLLALQRGKWPRQNAGMAWSPAAAGVGNAAGRRHRCRDGLSFLSARQSISSKKWPPFESAGVSKSGGS